MNVFNMNMFISIVKGVDAIRSPMPPPSHLAFVLFPRLTLLDFVGPYDALRRVRTFGYAPELRWSLLGTTADIVDEGGVRIGVDAVRPSLDPYDLLVLPGGLGADALLDTDAGWGSVLVQGLERFRIRTAVEIALEVEGDAPDPAEEAERIAAGVPRMGVDLDDSVIPQEAELEVDAGEVVGCVAGDEFAGRDVAGDRDETDVGVAHDRVAGGLALSGDDVEHAGRQPHLMHQLGEAERRERRASPLGGAEPSP
mgnify:CR=1 FL=1